MQRTAPVGCTRPAATTSRANGRLWRSAWPVCRRGRHVGGAAVNGDASAAAPPAGTPAPTPRPPPPPEAPRQPEPVTLRGRPLYTDDYGWMARAGSDEPSVLAHLSAENKYSAAALSGSKALRKRLAAMLGEFYTRLAIAAAAEEAAESEAAATEAGTQSRPDVLLRTAGGAGGRGATAMEPPLHAPGFGAAGVQIGGHLHYTVRPPGTARAVHYRRPITTAADGSDAAFQSDTQPAEVVFDESAAAAAAAAASGGFPGGYSLHSLEVSPCGDLLAAVERPQPGGPLMLRMLWIATCEEACAPVVAVAGPMAWACPWDSSNSSSSNTSSLAQQQHLLYLAPDEMQVRVLSFDRSAPSPPAAADVDQPPGGLTVYRDPFGVRARLWRGPVGSNGRWAVFMAGLAPDGAPLEVLALPPGGDPCSTGPEGWVNFFPLEPAARVTVSAWGDWLFARRWSDTEPGGALLAAQAPWSACTDRSNASLQWHGIAAAEPGCRYEALLLPPPVPEPSPGALPPGALLLCWRQAARQGADDSSSAVGEELVVRQLHFEATALPPGLTAQALQPDVPLPLPAAPVLLKSAAWNAAPRAGSNAGAKAGPQQGLGGLLTVSLSSLVSPPSRVVLDLASGQAAPLPAVAATTPPGFDPAHYRVAMLHATAPDGTRIPVTLAWHEARRAALAAAVGAANAPVVLHAYGSFGLPESEAGFDPARLLLMHLGFVVAVAHVRGGGWRGRAWAEAGRGAERKVRVSVGDLTAAADALVARGWCGRQALALAGASAGGWLVAAALTARPGLAAAGVLTVPCIDPLGALVTDSQGALEWGAVSDRASSSGTSSSNTAGDAEEAAVEAVAAWSPYQHLESLAGPTTAPGSGTTSLKGSISSSGGGSSISGSNSDLAGPPHLLLRTALHDRDVGFWDATKAVARLRHLRICARDTNTDSRGGDSSDVSEGVAAGQQPPVQEEGQEPLLLLRAKPGGHSAYEGDATEGAFAAAFLAAALLGPGAAESEAGPGGCWEGLDWN